ncbi:MAG TPA: GIY-YIG nuclease family protein [Firmicutes bacterium]|nr:GIY-YIG nuclease family protein [Bacillota bacterium]
MYTRIDHTVRGVYLLWLWLPDPQTIQVGALGSHHFSVGYYAYVGSAQNGLLHRLRRHGKQTKPLRWHIDYLRVHAELTTVHAAPVGPEWECRLAAALRRQPNATVPVPGFGSSDCRCVSHLVYFKEVPSVMCRPQLIWPELIVLPPNDLQ